VILEVNNIKKYFPIKKGIFMQKVGDVKALTSANFSIKENETVGVVGESGCGKTTLARVVSRIYKQSGGAITYYDSDDKKYNLTKKVSRNVALKYSRDVQMIFQDPYNALDPRMTIYQVLSEPLDVHKMKLNKVEREKYLIKLLVKVGLSEETLYRYPHEFSGGQRQRISIARALTLNPRLIICDEPTSALDVSVQSQVINLLEDLKKEFGISYLFISHNLDLIYHVSDRIMVMYLGHVIEEGPADNVFLNPAHPYTKNLISSIPSWDPENLRLENLKLEGEPPSPIDPPPGCPFQSRCSKVMDKCKKVMPPVTEISDGHNIRCYLYGEGKL